METISRDMVAAALDAMGLYSEEVVSNDYSGRHMYGATCFAVTLDTIDNGMEFVARLCQTAFEDAIDRGKADLARGPISTVVDLAQAVRYDSMGRATVVYFPGWELADDDEDDEQD